MFLVNIKNELSCSYLCIVQLQRVLSWRDNCTISSYSMVCKMAHNLSFLSQIWGSLPTVVWLGASTSNIDSLASGLIMGSLPESVSLSASDGCVDKVILSPAMAPWLTSCSFVSSTPAPAWLLEPSCVVSAAEWRELNSVPTSSNAFSFAFTRSSWDAEVGVALQFLRLI